MRAILVVALLTWAGHSAAQETTPMADIDVARRHYELGQELYSAGRFDEAIREFDLARANWPRPAFEFNIGRCHERLGHWEEAARSYEQFLAASPDHPEAGQVRERVVALKERAKHPPPPSPKPPKAPSRPVGPPPSSLRIAAITVGVLGLAAAAGGSGAYFSEYGAFDQLRSDCAGLCDPMDSRLVALRARVDVAERAGIALWVVAGVAGIVDGVLWGLEHRHRLGEQRARRAKLATEVLLGAPLHW